MKLPFVYVLFCIWYKTCSCTSTCTCFLDISLIIHVGLDFCAGLLLCQLEKILTGDSAPIVVLTIRDVHKGRHLQRYLRFWSFLNWDAMMFFNCSPLSHQNHLRRRVLSRNDNRLGPVKLAKYFVHDSLNESNMVPGAWHIISQNCHKRRWCTFF